ncbi:immunoglobulin A1 protease-like [Saccostrea echinata]|uniref:immunoglobulin A1 protease-like n=1 Tax=Saccostrea echinata TaxID=191078 RepID=UPI002A80002E|nr:immunoglobulin A1 protease-like [Saccostrea echinata]
MSLRVHLLFNLPQYPITGISIVLIFVGVCSVAASVFGFIEVIWGSYIAAGAWGGGMAVVTGLYGAGAAYSKGVHTVMSFTIVAFFCCLVSVGQGVMSAAGLDFSSGFYSNGDLYKDINEGMTKLIHAILSGTAGLQFVLALILAIICTRHICIGRKREKANQKNLLYGSSPFQRGNERASSSSQAPLVSGSGRKKAKNKRQKSNSREHHVSNQNHTPTTCTHHQTFTDSEQKVRGRRFGNMPVAGANVVEAQNFSRNNSRNSSVRGHRGIANANESIRSSRRRQRPPLPLQGSRYDHETQGLLTQVQNKLALESGDTSFIDDPVPEVMIVPRASVSEFDLLEDVVINDNRRSCDPSPNFIPITDTHNQPVSIEDDDELPPYEETVMNTVERTHISESSLRSNTEEEINDLDNFDRHSDSLTFNSDLHSSSTFRSEEMQSNKGSIRPVSYFDEPQNPMQRERSYTLGTVPLPQTHLLDPLREKFMQDYFFTEQDPQGVSYCEFSREGDKIIEQMIPKHNDDSKYSVERALQRENSLKNTRKPSEAPESKSNDFCYPKPFFPGEIDPRRLSKASTVSLPAGFAPPKPPRIFTVEMSSLQSPLNESQELAKPAERKPVQPLKIDLSQVVLRRKKSSSHPPFNGASNTQSVSPGVSMEAVESRKTGSEYNKDTVTPLSIKTSHDPFSSFSQTKPYAQSSPKLKNSEQLSLPAMLPGLSPVSNTNVQEKEKSENSEKDGSFFNEDRKGIKSIEKNRKKLDVKRKDPHPLSLLPYLTRSVSEFTNGNSIQGMDRSGNLKQREQHGSVQPYQDDSDEDLKKFLGIQSNDTNSRSGEIILNKMGLKPCNVKSLETEKVNKNNNSSLSSDKAEPNPSVLKVKSMPYIHESVSVPVSSQDSNAARESRTQSQVESSSTPESTVNENEGGLNHDQPSQSSTSRQKPIYSILL